MMIARLDIDGWIVGGKLYLVPNSSDPDGGVVFEMPPEIVGINATVLEFGAAVLRAAERCREGFDLRGANSDSVAVAIGFKSNSDLQKKAAGFSVSRRAGGTLLLTAYKRVKSKLVLDDQDVECPIIDSTAIGESVKRMVTTLSLS